MALTNPGKWPAVWPRQNDWKALSKSFPPGEESAQTFGMLKASQEKSGTRLDDFDLIIAACALAHNLTLVTNNIKHFKRTKGL